MEAVFDESLIAAFVEWFQKKCPGRKYLVRRGVSGIQIVCEDNGEVFDFSVYWAEINGLHE